MSWCLWSKFPSTSTVDICGTANSKNGKNRLQALNIFRQLTIRTANFPMSVPCATGRTKDKNTNRAPLHPGPLSVVVVVRRWLLQMSTPYTLWLFSDFKLELQLQRYLGEWNISFALLLNGLYLRFLEISGKNPTNNLISLPMLAWLSEGKQKRDDGIRRQ